MLPPNVTKWEPKETKIIWESPDESDFVQSKYNNGSQEDLLEGKDTDMIGWYVALAALFSFAELNSGWFFLLVRFVHVSVNTEMELCVGPQQTDQDLFEEAVSVRVQTNSGTIYLWHEHDSTLDLPLHILD